MEKRQNIFILGNSLILGALGESLQRGGQYELTNLALPKDIDALESMKPDAILFDLETPYKEIIFSMSERCSKLLLVGVSQDTNIVKVWVERQLRELSMQGLLAVIKNQLNVSRINFERSEPKNES